jgi:phosphoribosylformylglycinamidine synthase
LVYRVYVEKREGLAVEAESLAADIRTLLQIEGLQKLRLFNRYDLAGLSKALFDESVRTILSEPQLDRVFEELPQVPGAAVFAVEYQPGQFDQRADSAAQCIQILSQGERPLVRNARIYLLEGELSEVDISAIKKYVINPVESREASLAPVETLTVTYPLPEKVAVIRGFRVQGDEGLLALREQYGLAMDLEDLQVCREYFFEERRDPTMTELRVIDTYWSDHCRHTTFLTAIVHAEFEDPLVQKTYEDYLETRRALGRTKPVSLMDMGTIAAKYLRQAGKLPHLDESEEVNACTVKIQVETPEGPEDWLLLFKNETHNHPTEIEPFGGAATCIGGAIRDPLSGRSYVYAAMRVTGAANPLKPVSETLPGKLPQRTIVTKAAAGYSSYGNQIGLTTGQVDEIYHPGYEAKRMEIGAVIGAAPAENVRREVPEPGDLVILLGGRTGRDGCGGATGSSKSHTAQSLETGGPEVQKGNAPEERKLQRLFRNKEAALLIKRCNDFGAGGVSVAIGELAEGLSINLDAVPKKYEGLDGTELAVSESQERMAVVVAAQDVNRFLALAALENLEATVVAQVTGDRRLTMAWNGETIVDLSRDFLDTNGAEKYTTARVQAAKRFDKEPVTDFVGGYTALAADLNVCSKRGLGERFCSTIGSGTVLMPFGGLHQQTPPQAMVHKIPRETGETETCSLMAWGYNPFIAEKSP